MIYIVIGLCMVCIFFLTGLYSYKKISMNTAMTMVVSLVLFAVISIITIDLVRPMYSYTVTVEVTGEKNSVSKGYDVGIQAIKYNGKNLDINSKNIKGNWIFGDQGFSWGYSEDKSIEFLIPCYADCKIILQKNIWAGIINVRTYNTNKTIDLFSADDETYAYEISRMTAKSSLKRIGLLTGIILVEFVFLYLLCLFLFSYVPKKVFPDDNGKQEVLENVICFIKSRPMLFVRIFITLTAFITMLLFAGKVSLWADDLATIAFVSEKADLRTIVGRVLQDAPVNPPLFYIFAFFWLRIAPYGTVFLKLPCIIFSCLGIWLCGAAAKRIQGERAAVIAVVFSASSIFLVNHASFTFRCYGLYFMLCPLVIIAYYKRLEQPDRVVSYIRLGILCAMLPYSHYTGMLIIGAIGLYDCWLFARKKIDFRFIFSYVLAGFLFLPMLIIFTSNMSEIYKVIPWTAVPDFNSLASMVTSIFSNQWFMVLLFLLGIIIMFFIVLSKSHAGWLQGREICNMVTAMMITWAVIVLGLIYIYSRYINPEGSIFVSRYLISVLAPALIVAAISLDWILLIISENKSKTTVNVLSAIVICSCLFTNSNHQFIELNNFPGTINEPYEQCIDWIYDHHSAHQDNALVTITGYADGFYYYGTHGGQRPDLNYGMLDLTNWKRYEEVFISCMHGEVSEECRQILDKHYSEIERNDTYNVVVYRRKPEG